MKKVTKNMTFAFVISKYPEAVEVFMNEGMFCIGCSMAANESIEDGCKVHGINPEEIVEKINKKLEKK